MFLELKNELLHLSNAGMTGWPNALLKLKSFPGPSKRIFWSFIAQKGRCSLHGHGSSEYSVISQECRI
jgi:hypothetical protein